ncbi:arylsulfatase [Methylomagnum ishizawai]|uniref:arylsulfatase n=1 Tax=Methylomagnum ishizawai TaxID=1760988 RepID=UPI001C33F44D|nr:arylsulfatase [Methylomagnum ishizawai]BBL76167.1 arylsulfatase [Methylomagnum ishizawai]
MTKPLFSPCAWVFLGLVSAVPAVAKDAKPAPGPAPLDRSVLPIAPPKYPPIKELDARKAKAPPRFEVKAPPGAPNVVIVLLDDFGFGQSSAFGGAINMPTLDRLAQQGLKYNQFHVTALCSPTRAALLTGRNHHSVNAGAVMDIATGFPGYNGVRPNAIAPLAEILRLNGYSTAAFGKYHETPPWEISPSGPTDRWPTHSGFDKFYGFIGGETNMWAPTIYDGVARVEPPHDPNYHFTTDMTNQAIAWVRQQQSLTPDRPFFVYYAPGATHAPHHVPKAWADKYKGRFDTGWDRYREETLARQKQLGVVPPNTQLAPTPEAIPAWNTLGEQERQVYARQMEVYAGFGEHTDHEIGRLVQTLEDMGEMDNTLFVYIVGDNGASPEGSLAGAANEMNSLFNGIPEPLEQKTKLLADWGGPETFPHYAVGWANAGNAPFNYGKQVASRFGGNQNPLVIHWPQGIKAQGEVRSQFHHVIDIAPTVLEAAHIPQPKAVNGTAQKPMEGVSLAYTFNDPKAGSRHHTQYFEIAGNRGIYHDGWFAGTVHKAPWEPKPRAALDQDQWELYRVVDDFSQAEDLAAKNPAKLKELQALFLKEAGKYQVLPLDDRTIERLDPAIAGRPDLMGGRTTLTVYPGGVGMAENAFINVKNRSHSITAELEIPQGGAEGVVVAQGGRFAGWSLYFTDGKPVYLYNWVGMEQYKIAAPEALPAGKATLRYEFAYDGGGRGKGGIGSLYVNGKKVAEGRIDKTVPNLFSADETANVGVDGETPVTQDYRQGENHFTGQIAKVTIDAPVPTPGVAATAPPPATH